MSKLTFDMPPSHRHQVIVWPW